jgi:hypothetical protein
VPVPAGEHTVVFRFQSAAMRNGLILSLISLLLILGLLAVGIVQGRRALRPVAAAAHPDGP